MDPNKQSNEKDCRRFLLGVSDFSTSEPLTNAELIVASGLDFIEPGLAKIAAMSEQDFAVAASRVKNQNIRVLSTNWFLPSELKVTGPDVDLEKAQQYLQLAMERAANLGATAIVFGSPGSRTVPAGFDEHRAHKQMIEFCQLCSDVIRCNEWDLKIAVEHVNHTETNFINTFAQAMSIVRDVDRPEIGLAADFYHFMMENESLNIMHDAGESICAVQLADPDGRQFPKPGTEIPELDSFLQILSDIGYSGGVSVEATVGQDLQSDCRDAVTRLTAEFG